MEKLWSEQVFSDIATLGAVKADPTYQLGSEEQELGQRMSFSTEQSAEESYEGTHAEYFRASHGAIVPSSYQFTNAATTLSQMRNQETPGATSFDYYSSPQDSILLSTQTLSPTSPAVSHLSSSHPLNVPSELGDPIAPITTAFKRRVSISAELPSYKRTPGEETSRVFPSPQLATRTLDDMEARAAFDAAALATQLPAQSMPQLASQQPIQQQYAVSGGPSPQLSLAALSMESPKMPEPAFGRAGQQRRRPNHNETDMQQIREVKLLRNRMSAQQSRERKRQLITTLEGQLGAAQAAMAQMQQQLTEQRMANEQLAQLVLTLRAENDGYRQMQADARAAAASLGVAQIPSGSGSDRVTPSVLGDSAAMTGMPMPGSAALMQGLGGPAGMLASVSPAGAENEQFTSALLDNSALLGLGMNGMLYRDGPL